ncbi:hypothetical protein L873DRAFT_1411146 [Choiromyces venosus 120613-1]|uniref:Uncharacterized protein n=1 Tax=Choiromyces venosus 120613-1 TaxID=1336337 RepID=A0A3N4J8F0_9PEZI|nr:hypothetical protein L873DRAFT_1411146 [Choiromyces venosus 120613-1]
MNPGSSPSSNRRIKQPEAERLDSIPDDLKATSGIPVEDARNPCEALFTLFQQAEETGDRIERLKPVVPDLAEACEECLGKEMAYVLEVYLAGVGSRDSTDAQRRIKGSIDRMDAFWFWVRNRTLVLGPGQRRAFTDPTRRALLTPAASPSLIQAGEGTAMRTRLEGQQHEQPGTLGTRPGDPTNEHLHSIPEGRESASRTLGEGVSNSRVILAALFQIAEEAGNRILGLKSLFPSLAAECEKCHAEEMAYAQEAFFTGMGSRDPTEAQWGIKKAIDRMDTFALWARNIAPLSGTGRRRAFTDPTGGSSPVQPSQTAMDACRQPRQQEQLRTLGTRPGDPTSEYLHTIPRDLDFTSETQREGAHSSHETLPALFQLAEEARDRIEGLESRFPDLAEACDGCIVREMANASVAYYIGMCSRDPTESELRIKRAIGRMDAFGLTVNSGTSVSGTGSRRASADPGHRSPVMSAPNPSTLPAGQRFMSARRQSGTFETLPEYSLNDPAGHSITLVESLIPVRSARPTRRSAAFSEAINFPDPPTRQRLSTGSLNRSPGERKGNNLKALWKRAMDSLGCKDPSP